MISIGTKVKSNKLPKQHGTVIGNMIKNSKMVAVEWESGELEKVSINNLDEVSFEKEYNIIYEKFEKALSILIEAKEMAEKIDTDLHTLYMEDHVDVSELQEFLRTEFEDWFEKQGWSPSASCSF